MPHKHVSNICSNPRVIQLLEGKGMHNNCYLLELCSEVFHAFGAFSTSLDVSLADQKDGSFNTHLKPLPYTAASWEYSKGFDLSFERECGIIQRKTKTNQEQHWGIYWDSQQQWTKWNLLACTKHTKINIFIFVTFTNVIKFEKT